MAGRILIYDGIAANRIILRCKLSSACYDVIPATSLADMRRRIALQCPDIVILDADEDFAASLTLCAEIQAGRLPASVPVLLMAKAPDAAMRVAALNAGAWDVVAKPLHDDLLMATLRRFLRQRNSLHDRRSGGARIAELGLLEDAVAYSTVGRVALVTQSSQVGAAWLSPICAASPHDFRLMSADEALAPSAEHSAPDIYVIKARLKRAREGLRLLSELRCRTDSSGTRTIIILDPDDDHTGSLQDDAAMALDLGADDVMINGFQPQELACRLNIQMAQKRYSDHLQKSLNAGMQLAVLDPLTGLYNRRYALPRLQRMLSSAQATGGALSLMVLDLDRFKAVNDTYGHAAGDAVLVNVASHLSETLRPQDLVARIGGEEFLIALADSDAASARSVAQHLRELIRSSPIALSERKTLVRVTLSIGVALFDGKSGMARPSPETFMDQADRALFIAKSEGRDQVTFARPAA
ncbi:diguanylate cyclase [Pseudoruegeria sp. SK021]|uniref:diguanylate cyclase n=1 Tax=Pseudoruegeria sp. SK021 TaxID=1933035 RepID=UPI000A23006F|nr:diguanylate cyclase [Pseudoruegeria sp. SK021]OSP54307.1 hypothetical protein BV911_13110 [Pseudoruegeria sp. SK021]